MGKTTNDDISSERICQRCNSPTNNDMTVIAQDPNMKLSKFTMGHDDLLECHYKFGIFEEPIRETHHHSSHGETTDSFSEQDAMSEISSIKPESKKSNSVQFGFNSPKKRKKKPVRDKIKRDKLEEIEEIEKSSSKSWTDPNIETISTKENERPQETRDSDDGFTVDCSGTTGVRVVVDTKEFRKSIDEKKKRLRRSIAGEEGGWRSFEAGLKFKLREKNELDRLEEERLAVEREEERIREEARLEAVREQQKKEVFRLKDKGMEWVPPEDKNKSADPNCLESFCLYMKLQLGQFSHFSVRTVSPDFENEQAKSTESSPSEDNAEIKTSPQQPEPSAQESPKQSSPQKRKKRRGTTIGFGFTKSKSNLSISSSSSSSSSTSSIEDIAMETKDSSNEDDNNDDIDRDKISIKTDSTDIIDEFLNMTKEAYGVHKMGAEVIIDKTRVGTKTVTEKTKDGAEILAEKTKEGATVVADKTLEIKDKTIEVIDDATKDIYPFGKPKQTSESKGSDDDKKSVKSSSSKSEKNSGTTEVLIHSVPSTNPVTPKPKRRKSSFAGLGFGFKKNKQQSKKKQKSLSSSSKSSSKSSLKMEPIHEMDIVEVDNASEKSRSIKTDRPKDATESVKSSDSVHIIDNFIETTKEAFDTTKKGAEHIIDKSNEFKNSIYENTVGKKNTHSSDTDSISSNKSNKNEPYVPTGDAHFQKIWKASTSVFDGDTKSAKGSVHDNKTELFDDFQQLPNEKDDKKKKDDDDELYLVSESKYSMIIDPPPPVSSSSSTTSSSSLDSQDPNKLYVVREIDYDKNHPKWKFWKKDQVLKEPLPVPPPSKLWVDS